MVPQMPPRRHHKSTDAGNGSIERGSEKDVGGTGGFCLPYTMTAKL